LDWELDNWEFVSLEKLEEMLASWNYDIEPWSKILFEPIKELLK
jgi:isopentenyldiphosphate isomerase